MRIARGHRYVAVARDPRQRHASQQQLQDCAEATTESIQHGMLMLNTRVTASINSALNVYPLGGARRTIPSPLQESQNEWE
jgi:hypothetical protein